MLKKDVVEKIATNLDVSKSSVESVIDEFENVTKTVLAGGEDITLTGFMKLSVVDVDAKEGKCVDKSYVTPAHKAVRVKVGKGLKDSVL